MKVDIIELNDSSESHERTTFLQIDDTTLVTVQGFGTFEYEWKVQSRPSADSSTPKAEAILSEIFGPPEGKTPGFYPGLDTFGVGMVWVEPRTFANVIRDILNNS